MGVPWSVSRKRLLPQSDASEAAVAQRKSLPCRYESCDCVGFTSLPVTDFGPEVTELRSTSEVCILAPLPLLAPVSVQLLSFREKRELSFR